MCIFNKFYKMSVNPWFMFDNIKIEVSENTYDLMEDAIEAEYNTAEAESDKEVYIYNLNCHLEDIDFLIETINKDFDGNIEEGEIFLRKYLTNYKKSSEDFFKYSLECTQLLTQIYKCVYDEAREKNEDDLEIERYKKLADEACTKEGEIKNSIDNELNKLNLNISNLSDYINKICNQIRDK